MRFEIYCHTSPDGKQYIGCTSQGWRERWKQHITAARAGHPFLLCQAIREYGEHTFKHSVLAVCTGEKDARLAECYWVDKCNTLAPAGYNSIRGGGSSVFRSEQSRRKMGAKKKTLGPLTRIAADRISRGHQIRNFRRKVKAAWLIAEMSF